jgi:3-oxoacyl-[acyl-carrier-protein] synthase III
MAYLEIKNVRIAGFSAAVPEKVIENNSLSLFNEDEAASFIATTGVERRHVANEFLVSDLCYEACERMIKDLNWQKEEIDALILVTQGPDYILPATACILQNRLGLSQECYSMDISLGCSGWVYGLSVASGLLSTGTMKKALLLAGDTTHATSPEDKSSYPLFGTAGTVTALEFIQGAEGFKYHFATDGSGYEAIIIPDGGFRNQFSEKSLEVVEIEPGIKRSRLQLVLNGMDVFAFGISKAPQTVNKLIEKFHLNKEEIDYFVFHQANKYMNERIRKKLGIDAGKHPYSLKNFGNTSSASIPLTILTELKDAVTQGKHTFICCGFGVGLSWGSVWFETDKIVCSDVVEI